MTVVNYTVGQLWEDFEKKEAKGIKEPYIYPNDWVKVQTKYYMHSQGEPKTNPVYEIAGQILPVVKQYEADIDLWYTVVRSYSGKEYTLYDDNIQYVTRSIGVDK